MLDPMCKGISLVHLHDFVVSRHGEAGLEKVCASLNPEVAKSLRFPLAWEWYPLPSVVDVDVAVCDALYERDYAKGGWLIGQFDLDRSVRSVYRFFFQFLAPTFVIRRAAKLWSTYYNCGRLQVEETGPKSCTASLTDFDLRHRCLCEVLRGAFAGALAATGVKNVRMEHPECLLDGKPASRFVGEWD
jgi:hypothetical protein